MRGLDISRFYFGPPIGVVLFLPSTQARPPVLGRWRLKTYAHVRLEDKRAGVHTGERAGKVRTRQGMGGRQGRGKTGARADADARRHNAVAGGGWYR